MIFVRIVRVGMPTKTVKSVEEQKHLLRKYARCFICTRNGHISRDCKSRISCSVCMGKHHVSICDKGIACNRIILVAPATVSALALFVPIIRAMPSLFNA